VATIEVLAMITYGQHYDFAQGWIKTTGGTKVLTGQGLAVAVTLMALMTAVNFLSIKKLATTNSAITWWKVGVPLLTIFVLAVVSFQTSTFTAADGFNPYGAKGILSAVSTSGIIFALLGFEQADQLPGESSNPRRDIPRAVIGSVVIGIRVGEDDRREPRERPGEVEERALRPGAPDLRHGVLAGSPMGSAATATSRRGSNRPTGAECPGSD
jgi:amino acid transporter